MVKRISDVDVSAINKNEVFFVDANVLFAIHFELSTWSRDKIDAYSSFVLELLKNGVTICVSALNLQEVYHLVEKCECDLYYGSSGNNIKRYRRIASERSRIAQDLRSKHLEISEQYTVVGSFVDSKRIEDFITEYESHSYDPIDFFTVKYNGKNCVNFITNDADFRSDSNINVYYQ